MGGVVRTSPFAGHPAIDEGADAFLARVPVGRRSGAHRVARRLVDLPRSRQGSSVVGRSARHSRGSVAGRAHRHRRARSFFAPVAHEASCAPPPKLLRRRSDPAADSIGAYVRARFGDEVNERLVDPLIGSIYAADTDDFSLAAVPQLAELAVRSRSVLLSARRPAAATGRTGVLRPDSRDGRPHRGRRRRCGRRATVRCAATPRSVRWRATARGGGSPARASVGRCSTES